MAQIPNMPPANLKPIIPSNASDLLLLLSLRPPRLRVNFFFSS